MADAEGTRTMRARYDAIWADAAPAVRAGHASLDPLVLRKDDDARRGLTLLARPAPTVAARIGAALDRLRALEPAQYYPPAADLHHTVLSLFTATADHAPYMAQVDAYRAAVAEAVSDSRPFEIAARGLTLARGAVLAQGFPLDGTLDALRERLRAALAERGLGAAVDQRYRLVTAHMTVVRFAAPLADPARFVDALAALRDAEFGVTRVAALELVLGDWYQSCERELPVAACPLTAAAVR